MKILICCLLTLLPVVVHANEYTPDKMSVKFAEAYCQHLVYMTKTQADASQILVNVIAKTKGVGVGGRKVVMVLYEYNTDSAGYFCAFFDYTGGRLQLAEFGELWPGGNKNTIIKPLY